MGSGSGIGFSGLGVGSGAGTGSSGAGSGSSVGAEGNFGVGAFGKMAQGACSVGTVPSIKASNSVHSHRSLASRPVKMSIIISLTIFEGMGNSLGGISARARLINSAQIGPATAPPYPSTDVLSSFPIYTPTTISGV